MNSKFLVAIFLTLNSYQYCSAMDDNSPLAQAKQQQRVITDADLMAEVRRLAALSDRDLAPIVRARHDYFTQANNSIRALHDDLVEIKKTATHVLVATTGATCIVMCALAADYYYRQQ